MKKILFALAAGLLLAPLAPAQNLVPGKGTPVPTPRPRPQLADERQLIETGSFDKPKVTRRTAAGAITDLLRYTHGEWTLFGPVGETLGSGLSTGLTNEIARTGRQCVYVDFDHVKKPGVFVQLTSGFIPIVPEKIYRIHLWGRNDANKPLILDQRVAVLRLQADFFQEDGETQTGEPVIKVQPIPGTPNRPLFFTADRWTEFWNNATAPKNAALVRLTWAIGTLNSEGETNGTVYFDDIGISGDRVPVSAEPPPAPEEKAPGEKPEAPADPASGK